MFFWADYIHNLDVMPIIMLLHVPQSLGVTCSLELPSNKGKTSDSIFFHNSLRFCLTIMRTGSWCVHYLISDPMVKDNNLRLINNELFQLFLQAVYCSEVRTSKLIFYLQLNFYTQFKIQFSHLHLNLQKKYMKQDDFVTWIIVCHIKATYDLVFKK